MIEMKETGNTGVTFVGEPHTSTTNYEIAEPPKYVMQVEVLPHFILTFDRKVNWFHRLTTRLIFGWKWSNLE